MYEFKPVQKLSYLAIGSSAVEKYTVASIEISKVFEGNLLPMKRAISKIAANLTVINRYTSIRAFND